MAGEIALDRGACNDFGREPGDLPRALPVGMHVVRKKPGIDRSRQECRHRHATASRFPGRRPAQGEEIGLGGAVESEIRHRQHAGERGDVENAARSTRHHGGQACVHEGRRRIDIEVESPANRVRITAGEGARRTNSGAVDEDVDVASCVGDRCHQAGDGIGLGQIARDMLDRHPVCGRDGGCCPLQAFRVAGDENQIVASSGKAARQGKTDASRSACDQYDGARRSRHRPGRHCGRHAHLPFRPRVPEGLQVRPARDRKRLTS